MARIWSRTERVVGSGFLVGPREVLTCAHVVAAALGTDGSSADPPAGAVLVDFPLGGRGAATVRASVIRWVPVGPDGGGDIAGLLLDEAPPQGLVPAPLVPVAEPYGLAFRTFGFPNGRPGGDWAAGVLADVQAVGWLQIEHERQTGRRIQPGYSGAPVWVESVQGVAGMVVAADRQADDRVAYVVPAADLAAAWPGVLDRASGPCPYVGLAAFDESDAEVFFGRDDVVARLQHAVTQRPLTAVVGPSGSGKSSVVRAGLVPRLRASGWSVAVFRPRADVHQEMAAALLRLLHPAHSEVDLLVDTPRLAEVLREGRVADVVARVPARPGGLLLVVDQFEELYTHQPDPQPFIERLVGLAGARVLITMRADFLNQALDHRVFADVLTGALEPVGPLAPDGLRAAIEQPAALRGAVFDLGLVRRILRDIGDQPGRLPLLEFTLALLWDRRRNNRITFAAYDAIGGVEGALTQRAEEVFARYTPAEQARVRHVLLQLVRPGEGTEAVRRIAARAELASGDWPLVHRLADDRLAVTSVDPIGADTVEIVHEALITGWDRLRGWVSADRDFRRWQERVRDQIRVWRSFGEDHSALLRGPLLAEARTWLADRGGEVTADERAFVERSEAAQAAADARLSVLYEHAMSRQLVANAELLRADRPNAVRLSVLLAAESLRRAPSFEADVALRRGIALLPERTVPLRHDSDVRTVRFTPDGTKVITAGDDASARVWDCRTGRRLLTLRHRDGGWVRAIAISPDGSMTVTGCENGEARLWSLRDGSMVREMLHGGWVGALAFSPDGALLATGCDDGRVRVWHGADRPLAEMEHDGWVRAVEFHPDGSLLLTGGGDHTARLWRTQGWTEAFRAVHDAPVRAVGFVPAGGGFGTASDDGTARRWQLSDRTGTYEELHRVAHDGPVTCLAHTPDGRLLATGSEDATARLWSGTGDGESVRLVHGGPVRAVVIRGDRVFTASDDGTARGWTFDGVEVLRMCHRQAVRDVAVGPDGDTAASASEDGTGAMWPARARAERWRLRRSAPVTAVCARGPLTAAAFDDGTVQLWSQDTLLWTADCAGPARVLAVDGRHVAAAADGGAVTVWSRDGGIRTAVTTRVTEPRALALDGDAVAVTGDRTCVVSADGRVREVEVEDSACAVRSGGGVLTVVTDSGTLLRRSADGTAADVLHLSQDWWGGAAVDAAGDRVAAVGRSGRVTVFDARSGAVHAHVDHQSWVCAVTFSPAGTLLATVDDDGGVRVWEVDGGRELTRLTHPATVTGVALTEDAVVAGTEAGDLHCWPLPAADLIAQATERLPGGMTHDEWTRYLPAEPYPGDGRPTQTDEETDAGVRASRHRQWGRRLL